MVISSADTGRSKLVSLHSPGMERGWRVRKLHWTDQTGTYAGPCPGRTAGQDEDPVRSPSRCGRSQDWVKVVHEWKPRFFFARWKRRKVQFRSALPLRRDGHAWAGKPYFPQQPIHSIGATCRVGWPFACEIAITVAIECGDAHRHAGAGNWARRVAGIDARANRTYAYVYVQRVSVFRAARNSKSGWKPRCLVSLRVSSLTGTALLHTVLVWPLIFHWSYRYWTKEQETNSGKKGRQEQKW